MSGCVTDVGECSQPGVRACASRRDGMAWEGYPASQYWFHVHTEWIRPVVILCSCWWLETHFTPAFATWMIYQPAVSVVHKHKFYFAAEVSPGYIPCWVPEIPNMAFSHPARGQWGQGALLVLESYSSFCAGTCACSKSVCWVAWSPLSRDPCSKRASMEKMKGQISRCSWGTWVPLEKVAQYFQPVAQ